MNAEWGMRNAECEACCIHGNPNPKRQRGVRARRLCSAFRQGRVTE